MIRETDFPQIGPAENPGAGRAVVALIRDRPGRHLLQLRDAFDHVPGGGTWSLFGGAVEAGEGLVAALVRELAEEIGVALSERELAPYGWLQGSSAWRPRVFVFDCARTVEPHQVVLGEGAGFGFFTAGQCRNLELSPLLKTIFPGYFGDMRN